MNDKKNDSLIENAIEDFGKTIREFRLKNGLTLQDLSELCSISSSYLWRIEMNKRNPDVDVRIRILEKGLGFSVEDIYNYLKKYLQKDECQS